MKKTTWAIIGLSLMVLILATALGVVVLQKKTKTVVLEESDPYAFSYKYFKPWERFSLAPPLPNIYGRYSKAKVYVKSHPEKGLTFYYPDKELIVHHNDKVTYVVYKEKK